jgi:primosomal protein N' (replication factor Y)
LEKALLCLRPLWPTIAFMSQELCQVVPFLPLSQVYTYKMPPPLASKILLGSRVVVPLGSREVLGVVVKLGGGEVEGLKEIQEILDPEPPISPSLLELTHWASHYYLEPWGLYLRCALPPSLRKKKAPSTPGKTWVIFTGPSSHKPTLRQQLLLEKIIPLREVSLELITTEWGFSRDLVNRLVRKGWLALEKRRAPQNLPFPLAPSQSPLTLTPQQKEAYEKVAKNLGSYTPFLLHGVTGSGKTELYLQWSQECIEKGMDLLLLIPEISLTPQYISRFTSRFGDRVGVLHSGLTPKERLEEWLRIREGKTSVVLGTRSALFAPLKKPGLIIVDEEHDTSFKQDESPRYNARDLALVRAQTEKCPVVLASATPSLESYHNTLKGRYTLLELKERIGASMAQVKVINLAQERGLFSQTFTEGLEEALKNGGQALVLLNRRGYASFLICPRCGETVKCPNCDITLTLHRQPTSLKCHYCGHTQMPSNRCRHCHGEMEALGLGIQRIEEEIRSRFPNMRIQRMDRDALKAKGTHWEILQALEKGEIDVLLGTQMVAKGHHYPRISFVGVVLADTGLHLPDFRASERTFQLLTQVVGRAGRGGQGLAVIQTFMPSHPAVVWAARQNYPAFASEELKRRKGLDYPPFSHMARVLLTTTRKGKAETAARNVAENLRKNPSGLLILGPAPAPLSRLKNRYRWHILLKGRRKTLLTTLSSLPQRMGSVKIQVDMDPYNVL